MDYDANLHFFEWLNGLDIDQETRQSLETMYATMNISSMLSEKNSRLSYAYIADRLAEILWGDAVQLPVKAKRMASYDAIWASITSQ